MNRFRCMLTLRRRIFCINYMYLIVWPQKLLKVKLVHLFILKSTFSLNSFRFIHRFYRIINANILKTQIFRSMKLRSLFCYGELLRYFLSEKDNDNDCVVWGKFFNLFTHISNLFFILMWSLFGFVN